MAGANVKGVVASTGALQEGGLRYAESKGSAILREPGGSDFKWVLKREPPRGLLNTDSEALVRCVVTAIDEGDDGILAGMPVIAIFFGIVIRMHFKEHEPRHFHAEHQSLQGKFDFDGNQTVGNITSKNALDLIRQWAQLNRAALDANWANIKAGKPLNRIPPLE